MTAITPETGLRARLRRLAVFAIAIGACALTVPAPAVAADQQGSDDDQGVELHVAAGLRGTVAPGTSTSAIVTVDNDTDAELSSGRVQVELSRTPLTSTDAVSGWLDDSEAPGDFVTIGTDTTQATGAGESSTTTVFVPEATLGALAPGVYPLRAGLSGASTRGDESDQTTTWDATATTVLVVSASSTTQIGVLVPITATPKSGSLLTAEELATLTGPDGGLTAQLDGVAGTTAVLAIDPSIPAAIRALGSAAPAQAVQWLSRFDGLSNTRFALQFGDADATVQSQAGLTALLSPPSLATFLDPTRFPRPQTPTPTASPDTTATPSPGTTDSPTLPSDEELTDVDGALPRILWPADDLTQADLTKFAEYLGAGTTTIVPSTVVDGTSSAHATSGEQDLLVTDAAASAALSDAADEPRATARQRLLAEAAAHLTLAQRRAPGAPLLVGLERSETRTADALRDAISAADSIGFQLSTLRATTPVAVTVPEAVETSRAPALTHLLTDEQSLTAFSSILSDPRVLLAPERIRILRTIGVGSTAAEFDKKVAAHRAGTLVTLNAVSIPPSSTIQLLAANADLPIAVRNDLPWPVTVQLYASPSDPRLEVKPVIETTVQASSTTRVKVPVSARVGSGELDLRLSLYSPTGVQIQGQESIRVAVRAEWETIGLVVFGGLAVVLIGLGVIRTVRRKRREAVEEHAVEVAVEELIEEKEAEAAAQERDAAADAPATKESRE